MATPETGDVGHWLVDEDRAAQVVWLRRTARVFVTLDELLRENQQVVARLGKHHHSWGLVVDMRHAPSRNDPAFEEAMRGLRTAVEARFARTAVLLGTAAGVLQVNRITRTDGTQSLATQSEQAAFDFARVGKR